MTNTYEKEVWIERLQTEVLCEFDYNIEPEQKAITSGPPEHCQPGFPAECEIFKVRWHLPEGLAPYPEITEKEIMEAVGEDSIKEDIMVDAHDRAGEARLEHREPLE